MAGECSKSETSCSDQLTWGASLGAPLDEELVERLGLLPADGEPELRPPPVSELEVRVRIGGVAPPPRLPPAPLPQLHAQIVRQRRWR